jgi:signal transduction histidine kinase
MFERGAKGRDSHGHGLGLTFVEAVARAHGGTVAASNRPEGGARLTITLPLSPAVMGKRATVSHSAPA